MARKEHKEKTETVQGKIKAANAARVLSRTRVKETVSKDSFYIVGIGASAGGLEAFEQFFTHMPENSGMPFILIPHLDPTHKSIMSDLLTRYTKMKIFQAEDGMKVMPNCVYIIPPNKDMSILHGVLQLLEPKEIRGFRHPIDFFFRSLAEDQGERAICIVLSGTGTEGTLGLRAVKGEGGLVIVQDPKTAKYDGMPASAVATGLVDYVLPPEKMAEQLLNYIKHAYVRPLKPVGEPEGRPADLLQKIFILIRTQTKHDFSLYKQSTIMRRIERRMVIHQIGSLGDYVAYLRNTPHEIEELFKELLIRVTNFFRDPDAFEVLKNKVLPQVFGNRSPDSPVRIWVPGCSTGEEAYSLAMIFYEYMQNLKEKYKIQMFGTDIDSRAIESARAGMYAESITVDVSPERLSRFFIKKGNTYKIKDEIRETIVFAVQNLIKEPPFSKLDMISCRNLLIYLGSELQKRILPLFRYSLNPEGILFLGSSETIGEHTDMFSVIDKKWKIFKARRLEVPLLVPIELRKALPHEAGITMSKDREGMKPGEISIGDLTEKLLLDRYSPPCAIVNERGDILYLHGRTGKYLEPAPGKAALNIIDMAREGLRLELRAALRKVLNFKEDVMVERLQVKTNGGYQAIRLVLHYVKKPDYLQGLIMVVFQDMIYPGIEKEARLKARSKGRVDQQITELEFELKSTKEHLQITIEELETSNEEHKSTNEELQSANEELQSTNEELETSKEELQSVNEELVTLNSELQNKIDELFQINNDMNNLLASTQIATIFLNSELKIKRFTPATTSVINLIQTDVGRPLSDIVSKLEYPDLVKDVEEVLRTLAKKEKEVQGNKSFWYLVRIMPYRTVTNMIDGVVITFSDITEQKTIQSELRQQALQFEERSYLPDHMHILVRDMENRIILWNKGTEQFYGWKREEALGQISHDLFQTVFPVPYEEIMKELLDQGQWKGELTHIRRDGSRVIVASHWVLNYDVQGKPVAIAEINNDITELKRIEEALSKNEKRLHAADKNRTGKKAKTTEHEEK
jgi:two-component system, chemotaxis family, CheB/CheR fusion protein